jgi:predicted HTH transcriptional regulator
MQIDASLVECLLYEEESHELDFKEEQYRFSRATNEEKCELLKDVLAFANGWRRADAFILIGVKEVKGGPSLLVGINHDLDDAQLQQFVNSKTQRPLMFSYRVVQVQ